MSTLVDLLENGVFTTLVLGLAKIAYDRWEKKQDRGKAKVERIMNEMDLRYTEMDNDIKGLKKDFERTEKDTRTTELVLLHDRIWQIFRVLKDRPEITVEEEANIDYLYGEYQKKGGNHKARSMYRFLKKKEVVGGLVDDDDDNEEEEWEDFLKERR